MTVSPFTKLRDIRPPNDNLPNADSSADKARRQIDLEVQRLEDSIRTLKSRRNSLAPIARLPPELLSRIFSFRVAECAGASNPLEWVRVSHVSRHWRAAALECPSLWGTLVFSRPKWCEEMLKRSKMASLVIKADLTCLTPKILDAVRLALHHASRIVELQLHGSSATIERLLSDTSFKAPMLRSFSLAVPRHTRFGTDEGVNIPENTLNGEMPYLRNLELTKCNVRWDSPLLCGLTHLKIHEISTESRPTMQQFLDVLERMPGLEVLDLQGALPRIEISPSSSPERIIILARISHITIKSSVPECVNLVNCINIPSNARVHLSCSGTETTGSDFSGILKILSNDSQSASGATSEKRKIRVLRIYNEASQSLVVQGWTRHPEEMHIGSSVADIQLHLSWHSSSSPAVDVIAMTVCKAIPFSHLRSLRMSHVVGMGQEDWASMFGTLPRLHNVHIAGSSAHTLVSVLRQERPSGVPILPSSSSRGCPSRRPGLRRTKSTMPSVYFPGLKTLTLEDVSFEAVVPSATDPFQDLKECLAERCDRKAAIQELRIKECSHLGEADVELLKEVVVSVEWDEIEKGFTDDDDDYGYGYDPEGFGLWSGGGYDDSDSDLEFAAFPF